MYEGWTSVAVILCLCDSHFIYGWSGGAKVACILHHRGVQQVLAYSWARPAIIVAGNGRGEMFLFLLFLYFHSCSSFFPVHVFYLFYYLFYLFSPFLWETTEIDPQGLTCRLTLTQSISSYVAYVFSSLFVPAFSFFWCLGKAVPRDCGIFLVICPYIFFLLNCVCEMFNAT